MEYEKLQKAERETKQQELNLTGIPTQMKWDLEARSGLSLDDVRVHYHSDEPAKLGALAYTQGTQVHIGPGQEGRLRHELGHVVQQKLGLVRANARYPGGPALNTEEALERQADAIGAGTYFRPMPGAGMPPVQRLEDPVVQAAGHITYMSPVVPGAGELELPDADGPTIVFEAMGVDANACKEVYEQTKLYEGNTICVFGLNAEASGAPTPESDFAREQVNLTAYQSRCAREGAGSYFHLLYTFSFGWARIPDAVNRGYPMPFVEARVLVMQQAAKIIEQLEKPDGDSGLPNQYKFLYRWIDADAEDDSTSSLDPSQLNAFADMDNAGVLTGRYDWRSKYTKEQMPNYLAFIEKFNEAEKQLRDYYYLLRHYLYRLENFQKVLTGHRSVLTGSSDSSDANQRKIDRIDYVLDCISKYEAPASMSPTSKNNKFLPGYYLPETVLMMNGEAHRMMREVLPDVTPEYVPDSGLAKVDISPVGPQDKESMRLVSRLYNAEEVNYQTKLCVTKPLKNELSGKSYWGKDMLGFLSDPSAASVTFITALANVRQSAFDPTKWYFANCEPWSNWEIPANDDIRTNLDVMQESFNQRRRELADRLSSFLNDKVTDSQTRLQRIAYEISLQT